MSQALRLFFVCAFIAMLTTGCYTLSTVRFGNGTTAKVKVRSSQTGQEIEVAPARFEKLPHAGGDLIVTTTNGQRFRFSGIDPPRVDGSSGGYLERRGSIFGPGYITLRLLLGANSELHALLPGKKTVESAVPQPDDYPKTGQRMAD